MRWLCLLLLLSSAHAQDLADPASPSDYRSAFFGADFRGLTETAYANWIAPGHEFCRVKAGENCDGSSATPAQVSGAVSTWGTMSQCNRWRVRLHHQGLTWVHNAQPKIEVQYYTGIPVAARAAIASCLVSNEFEYLGQQASGVCSTLNARTAGLCARFWSGDKMNTVVFGWEADAN